MKQTITWLGHGSWKMTTEDGIEIYVDPWLDGNPACPIGIADVKRADVVAVTHGHNDHIGDSIELCKRTGAVLVTLPEVATYANRWGIPYDQGGGTVHTGGTVTVKGVRFTATFALHYSDILGYEYNKDGYSTMPGCGCCGFVVTPETGKTVYFAGDTGLFGDMELIGKMYRPEVAVLPVGGKYGMGVYEASWAASLLRSPVVIPGHFNTFPNQMADMDEFERDLKVLAPFTKLCVLTPGGFLEL